VAVRSSDELGQMAADFDTMIGYLSETVEVAETIARGNLDVESAPAPIVTRSVPRSSR
jgi:hypothetical protein